MTVGAASSSAGRVWSYRDVTARRQVEEKIRTALLLAGTPLLLFGRSEAAPVPWIATAALVLLGFGLFYWFRPLLFLTGLDEPVADELVRRAA